VQEKAAANKQQQVQNITVPIMGEGIRNAKVVALLKQPGDKVELDDPLCEVETDKAVYPIESSFAGTMGEWKTAVDEPSTSDRRSEPSSQRKGIGKIRSKPPRKCRRRRPSRTAPTARPARRSAKRRRHGTGGGIEPALSPTSFGASAASFRQPADRRSLGRHP
jgi:hypothetical protein